MKNVFQSANVGQKWIVFKQDADLAEFDEAKIIEWVIESKECTTGSLIQAADKISVGIGSAAFQMAYSVAFAEVHMTKVEGPKATDKPDKAFIENLPLALLTAFVNRVDTSRDFNAVETSEIKKPKPSAEPAGDSASS